jgi:hypothetical protein
LVSPFELPSMNVRFCKLSCGWSWFWQCEVVHFCAWSQVFMYRMRTFPPPESATLPPPSITIFGPLSLKIFAVWVRVMVTGLAPQLKVMTPPLATASTNA